MIRKRCPVEIKIQEFKFSLAFYAVVRIFFNNIDFLV